jgi:hypothetical protein
MKQTPPPRNLSPLALQAWALSEVREQARPDTARRIARTGRRKLREKMLDFALLTSVEKDLGHTGEGGYMKVNF